jgi:probable HAF family extracellular repeat protein
MTTTGGGGGQARWRVIEPVADHALRPADDPPSIVRRTIGVGATKGGSVVAGYCEIFVLAGGSAAMQGEEAFRWTESGGTVGLGFLPGVDTSEPRRIASRTTLMSEDGSVVIGQSTAGPDGRHVFRWTATSGMVALGPPSDEGVLEITATSRDGAILVGGVQNPFEGEAVRWTEAQGMVRLGRLPGHTQSVAMVVSEDGTVAFGKSISDTASEVVRWTASGMTTLGRLPGADSCTIDVNSGTPDGKSVVGTCAPAVDGAGSFLWSEATGMISLGAIPGHLGNSAWRVSRNGAAVIGFSANADNHSDSYAWTKSSGMVSLIPPGHTSSMAFDLSDDGTTVVGSSTDAAGKTKAFRWTAAAGFVDLPPLAGHDAADARKVSADGSVIAGWSTISASKAAEAVYWDRQGDAHSIAAELVATGVDLQGFNLTGAAVVSTDGTKVFRGLASGPPGIREWVAWLP